MAGAKGNNRNRQGELIPSKMDPTRIFESFAQRMVYLGGTNSNIVQARPPHSSKILERFRALRPEKFDGMDDPSKAEQCLHEMDLIFDTIECSNQEKRRMALSANLCNCQLVGIGESYTRSGSNSRNGLGHFEDQILGKVFPYD